MSMLESWTDLYHYSGSLLSKLKDFKLCLCRVITFKYMELFSESRGDCITRGQCYKTFSVRNLRIFHPSLTFVGKSRSLSYSWAPERCFTQIGLPANIRLGWKGLQGTNTLAYYGNYISKKFYNVGPRPVGKVM